MNYYKEVESLIKQMKLIRVFVPYKTIAKLCIIIGILEDSSSKPRVERNVLSMVMV